MPFIALRRKGAIELLPHNCLCTSRPCPIDVALDVSTYQWSIAEIGELSLPSNLKLVRRSFLVRSITRESGRLRAKVPFCHWELSGARLRLRNGVVGSQALAIVGNPEIIQIGTCDR